MSKIVNLTPHPITILDEAGNVLVTFPKSDITPRLSQQTIPAGKIAEVPITQTTFGETENLPSYEEGVFLIISRLVMSANPNRNDLLVPNELVRDEKGLIVGCRSLASN